MSVIESMTFKDPTANRLSGAFRTLQAANALSLVCRASKIEVGDFHKMVASCFRLYADMVEEPTEQRFADFGTLVIALLKYEGVITEKVIEAHDRLEAEESAKDLDELDKITKGGE